MVADLGHELLRRAERQGRAGGHLGDLRAGELEQLARGQGPGEQPGLDGLGAREELGRVDQVQGAVRAQALGEEPVAARVQGGAEVRERRADLRVLCHVDHVRGDRQAEPDAQACALHGREGRHGALGQGAQHGGDPVPQIGGGVVVGRGHAGDVAARAEAAALAAQQHRADLAGPGPGRDLGVRGAEVRQGRLVQGVHLLRGVQRHLGDAVGHGQLDHAHRVLPAAQASKSTVMASPVGRVWHVRT